MLEKAIIQKYGYKDGLGIVGEAIVQWPYDSPIPDAEELQSLRQEGLDLSIKNRFEELLKVIFSRKAQEKDYADELSIASYSDSTKLSWKQEATDFIAWRDKCWEYAYQVLGEVKSGAREIPSQEEFLNGLPRLQWS